MSSESPHAEEREQKLDKQEEISDESLAGDDEKALPPEQDKDVEAAPATEEKPAPPIGLGPVPDGGAKAWMQVLGSWMLFFNTWGILK